MTNILEKALITGFGIFTLMIFVSFTAPFIMVLIDFNINENDDLQSYINIIDEIDTGINYIIQNPDLDFLKTIDYPNNLNMTFVDNFAKFNFKIEERVQKQIIEYPKFFITKFFENLPSQIYLLNITMKFSNILINLI